MRRLLTDGAVLTPPPARNPEAGARAAQGDDRLSKVVKQLPATAKGKMLPSISFRHRLLGLTSFQIPSDRVISPLTGSCARLFRLGRAGKLVGVRTGVPPAVTKLTRATVWLDWAQGVAGLAGSGLLRRSRIPGRAPALKHDQDITITALRMVRKPINSPTGGYAGGFVASPLSWGKKPSLMEASISAGPAGALPARRWLISPMQHRP